MIESQAFFSKMVDELVEFSEFDPELSDGIKWLDNQALKKGITFYDMVFEVLYKHDVNSKAKDWLKYKKLKFIFSSLVFCIRNLVVRNIFRHRLLWVCIVLFLVLPLQIFLQ